MTTVNRNETVPATALVLAGGRGERLRPLTDARPKPMVLVDDSPLLDYHLRWLHANGVTRAILLVGYLQEVVRDYFAAERIPGLTVECVGEDQPLGRGGAIRHGFEAAGLADEVVVATNGDVITDQPLAPLARLHREAGALVTILLTTMVSPYGIVDVDDAAMVRDFREKPALPYWINAGAYLLSADAIRQFPAIGDHETEVFPRLAREGRVAGFKSDAYWCSVESAKELRQVGEFLKAGG